jgi:ferrous iron transport protein B
MGNNTNESIFSDNHIQHIRLNQKDYHKKRDLTEKLDAILLNRYAGFPIMILCFVILFAVSFSLGKPISTWLGLLLDRLVLVFENSSFGQSLPALAMGLFSDGIMRGIGSALAFFPQMLIFFTFYTLVTDTGYASRIAYLMHRPMSKINMDGRAFAPLILGYGCNITSILGTRDIPSRTDRLLVMLVSTFTPCSARLGVILYIAAAFFSPLIATLVMSGLIVLSWLVSATVSFVVKKRFPGRKNTSGVPELPAYHFPTALRVVRTATRRPGLFESY